jgi:hypothetical protein
MVNRWRGDYLHACPTASQSLGWRIAMNRSTPIWDNDGPEYEKPEETREERMERLSQHEMNTRLIEAQVDLLLGVIESYRAGWKQ